jgi:hypothetical protein
VSSDSKRAPDGALSAEPHTDPMIPVITDDMLPPLENPRVPTLDDRALAALLAELDGDDSSPLEADRDPLYDPLDPVDALDRPAPRNPVRTLDGPPSPRPAGVPPPLPVEGAPPPRGSDSGYRRQAGPPSPQRPATPLTPGRPTTTPPGPAAAPPRAATIPPRMAGDGDTPDPSYLTESPVGPVLRSRYGEFRPPIASPTEPDVPSLTGLTRRSRSKLGSKLFTVVFVAIFVLILIQTVVSVFSESAGH